MALGMGAHKGAGDGCDGLASGAIATAVDHFEPCMAVAERFINRPQEFLPRDFQAFALMGDVGFEQASAALP